MALLTLPVIARQALATLYNQLVLAPLVYRDYDPDFSGKHGDTVTVRTPAVFEAKEFDRADGIELQGISEGSFDITLDTILDVSFPVTSEEMTLEIDDFRTRLLQPAMEAVAQDVDGRLAAALAAAARAAGQLADGSTTQNKAFRDARAILSRKKLPLSERYAMLSPEGTADVLGDDLIVAVDKSGSSVALREAIVGRLFGFETYESQVIGGGSGVKGEFDGVAFHRSAVALVTRTLEKPDGVADSQAAIENYKGLGLRVVKDYDIDKKQDVISVDLLMGVKRVRDWAAVELEFGQGS